MKPTKKIKILFADDHSVVRDGLRALFNSSPRFDIVGEAADGEQALRLAAKKQPEVLLLDITMPKVNGIEATRLIKQSHPNIKVLILTVHEEAEYIHEIIRAGANGYVLKTADSKEIFAAVEAVAASEQFFSPSVAKLIVEEFFKNARLQEANPPPRPAAARLTKREQEVALIGDGLSNKEIAQTLQISTDTVKSHVHNVLMNEPIRLFIVDDNRLLREGLVAMLAEQEGIVVVGAASGSKAIEQIKDLRPEVALIDIGMPAKDGIEATQALHRDAPEVKVIILGMHDLDAEIMASIEAGASAYVLKEASFDTLIETIRAVHRGESFSSPQVTASLFSRIAELTGERELKIPFSSVKLTPREVEIINQLAEGLSNKQIAQQLAIETQTVKNHVHNILEKLQLHNRLQAVEYARERKLLKEK